jgi:hypothetical protein
MAEKVEEFDLSDIYEPKGYELVSSLGSEQKLESDVEQNIPTEKPKTIEKPSANEVQITKGNLFYLYINKFTGVEGKKAPPMQKPLEMVFSSILAFTGILLVSITDYYFLYPNFTVDDIGIKMLTGAYGATSGNPSLFCTPYYN